MDVKDIEKAVNHALMTLPLPESGAGKRAWQSLVEARDAITALSGDRGAGVAETTAEQIARLTDERDYYVGREGRFSERSEPLAVRVCATDGCGNPGTERFEYGGVGSHYCPECIAKIQSLRSALSDPLAGAAGYVPKPIHFDEGGFTEFVSEDGFAIYGKVYAANVENIVNGSGELIGFKVFDPPSTKPTHRHKKRGTEYVLLGIGKMQAENWVDRKPSIDGLMQEPPTVTIPPPVDMREVAVYRSATDPTEIWVRPREEFEDGRFEVLP